MPTAKSRPTQDDSSTPRERSGALNGHVKKGKQHITSQPSVGVMQKDAAGVGVNDSSLGSGVSWCRSDAKKSKDKDNGLNFRIDGLESSVSGGPQCVPRRV